MATIIFSQTGGATTTPPPTGSSAGALVLIGTAYDSLAAGAGNAVLHFVVANGPAPAAPTYGIGSGALAFAPGYLFNGSPAPAATGSAVIGMTGWSYESPNYGRGMINLYSIGYSPDISPYFADPGGAVSVEDVVVASSTATALQIAMMLAELQFSERYPSQLTGLSAASDNLSYSTALYQLYQMLATSNIQLSNTNTVTPLAVQQMIDALLLTGVVTNPMQALTAVIDALVFGALLNPAFRNTITDNAIFAAAVAQVYTAVAAMIDSVLNSAVVNNVATLAVAIASNAAILGTTQPAYTAVAALQDAIGLVLNLTVDNLTYIAWVLNTESTGLSRYTNYPFNSFMKVGGKYYGATDTGIYQLDGADDAGTPIASHLRLGMHDLGARAFKRVPSAYFSYDATGDLLFKVVISSPIDGLREAHCYKLKATNTGSMGPGRVVIGKGLTAVYWDFVVENISGAYFSLAALDIYPIALERNVRGNSSGVR